MTIRTLPPTQYLRPPGGHPRWTERSVQSAFGPPLGSLALCAIAASLLLAVLICLFGATAAVPDAVPVVGHATPPWKLPVVPAVRWVNFAAWAAMLLGGCGSVAGLVAVRCGWRPSPRRLLAGSALAGLVLALLPAAGSIDVLVYACYGRLSALGADPYVLTSGNLYAMGDPVGHFAPAAWRTQPAVYSPVAIALFRWCARVGGTSMADIVQWLKLAEAFAFLATALLLDRLAGSDTGRRVRAHLLWSLNPLVIWHVVVGGHIDGVAVLLVVAGLTVVRATDRPAEDTLGASGPELAGFLGALVAGLLLGAAIAVKAPMAVAVIGVLLADRRSPARFCGVLAGTTVVLWLVCSGKGLRALLSMTDVMQAVSRIDSWQVTDRLFGGVLAHYHQLTALTAAIALLRYLPPNLPGGSRTRYDRGDPGEGTGVAGARIALVVYLAWLLTTQTLHPWYAVTALALFAVLPGSPLTGPLLVWTVCMTLGYLPLFDPVQYPRLAAWNRAVFNAWIAPSCTLALIAVLLLAGFARRQHERHAWQ